MSLLTGRPVMVTPDRTGAQYGYSGRVAFLIIMPLALFFGILAGINEGKPLDRFVSITSLGATATPEFVTGVFLS